MKLINKIEKKRYIEFILIIIILIGGLGMNLIYPFPHFFLYYIIFFVIGLTARLCVIYFNACINKIIGLTTKQPPFQKARFLMLKMQKAKINYLIPILFILTFGIGGCYIFTNLQITLTFLICLVIFVYVVFWSIIGYLKYVYLGIFLFEISKSDKHYCNLPSITTLEIPPDINWYKIIVKLYMVYQTAFFILGTLYAIAFAIFCFAPEYGVLFDHFVFYLLWTIIFIAIVLAFPIIAVFDATCLNNIKKNISMYYFVTLKKEKLFFENSHTFSELLADLFRKEIINRAFLHYKSKTLSFIYKAYGLTISVINFCISLITIFQFLSIDIFMFKVD